MNQIAKVNTPSEIMENVLIRGDLGQLTAEERSKYYTAICTSVGLNPLTKPFEYIVLNGKLRLYALKDCTDQLRSIHSISVTEMVESERDGVFVVKTKVANAQGRTDMSTGAVNIANLKGEALANALMKAETKAKRRATLSICGLGLLDETEVDDIPSAQKSTVERPRVPSPSDAVKISKTKAEPFVLDTDKRSFPDWTAEYLGYIAKAKNLGEIQKWDHVNTQALDAINAKLPDLYNQIDAAVAKRMAELGSPAEKKPDPITSGPQRDAGVPSVAEDYDGFISYMVEQIAKQNAADKLEALFNQATVRVEMDALLPPDRDELMGLHDKKMRTFE